MKMSEFVRDCLKIDLLKYQEMMLDLYEKGDFKRNDILKKRFGIPMEKSNLNGTKIGQMFVDEFASNESEG